MFTWALNPTSSSWYSSCSWESCAILFRCLYLVRDLFSQELPGLVFSQRFLVNIVVGVCLPHGQQDNGDKEAEDGDRTDDSEHQSNDVLGLFTVHLDHFLVDIGGHPRQLRPSCVIIAHRALTAVDSVLRALPVLGVHMPAVVLLGKTDQGVVVRAGHAPLGLLHLAVGGADMCCEAPETALAPDAKAAVRGVAGEAGEPVHQVDLLSSPTLEVAEVGETAVDAVVLRVVIVFEGPLLLVFRVVCVLILTIVDRFLRFLQLLYKSLVDIDIFGLGVKVLEVVHIVLGLSVQRLEGVWQHC